MAGGLAGAGPVLNASIGGARGYGVSASAGAGFHLDNRTMAPPPPHADGYDFTASGVTGGAGGDSARQGGFTAAAPMLPGIDGAGAASGGGGGGPRVGEVPGTENMMGVMGVDGKLYRSDVSKSRRPRRG